MGLSKAGPSGAGGDLEPLKRIRRDIFQRTNMIYCLKFNEVPTPDSCIIDIIYDGYTMEDPHSARPMIFVTNYQNTPGKAGWFGTFQAPNGSKKYAAVGKHKVTIKCAPRKAPSEGQHLESKTLPDGTTATEWVADSATQELGPRDFSAEAGGVEKTFEFEIFPDSEPPFEIPPSED